MVLESNQELSPEKLKSSRIASKAELHDSANEALVASLVEKLTGFPYIAKKDAGDMNVHGPDLVGEDSRVMTDFGHVVSSMSTGLQPTLLGHSPIQNSPPKYTLQSTVAALYHQIASSGGSNKICHENELSTIGVLLDSTE